MGVKELTQRQRIIKALEIAEAVDPGGTVYPDHDIFSVADPDIDLDVEEMAALGFRLDSTNGWYSFV